MIKLLVTAISITTKDYGVDRTSAKAVSPTLCYWHKKFHENVIECKKVGDQIIIDRLSPNLHDLISILILFLLSVNPNEFQLYMPHMSNSYLGANQIIISFNQILGSMSYQSCSCRFSFLASWG